jgi:hypothetical protein
MRHCLTRLHHVNDEIFIFHICCWSYCLQGPGGSMSYVVGLPNNWYKPITNTAWVRAGFVNYRKGALDSQPQVIKFTSCLPMVDGSLRVLRLLPPLTLPWSSWYSWNIAKSGVKHQISKIKSIVSPAYLSQFYFTQCTIRPLQICIIYFLTNYYDFSFRL